MQSNAPETLHFQARDGWQLTGSLFRGKQPTIALLISAGTGFPRRFYRHVAAYFASRGAVVLTYDYRGLGDSGNQDLANSNIDYPDWAKDMSAALDALEAAAPDLPLTHLCHSVGGHFIGLMPNHEKFTRHAFASVGSGYVWQHHLKSRPLELIFWWVLGPYLLLRHGYIKSVGGWRGEPLPPKVFKTWRRWCHQPGYFKSELNTTLSPEHYDAVTAPIGSWVYSDDPIANPTTADELLSCYPNAPHQIIHRSPADFGLKSIGHDGAFRAEREVIWDEFWCWLANGELQNKA